MTKSFRFLRRMCVILLALIGAYHVVLWLVPMAFRKSTVAESPYAREVRSPKDEYRAVLQTWAGGGGLSPYCSQAILVVPPGINLAGLPEKKRYEVYSSTECDSFANHSPSPEIIWEDARTLQIRVSINHAALTEQTVRLRKRDASGSVTVKFAADE